MGQSYFEIRDSTRRNTQHTGATKIRWEDMFFNWTGSMERAWSAIPVGIWEVSGDEPVTDGTDQAATRSFASPKAADRSSFLPARDTSSVALSPGLPNPTSAGKSPDRVIGCPSYFRITSPGSRPALAAGLPGATLDTSAPSGCFSL